jgi:hypothetical protein
MNIIKNLIKYLIAFLGGPVKAQSVPPHNGDAKVEWGGGFWVLGSGLW